MKLIFKKFTYQIFLIFVISFGLSSNINYSKEIINYTFPKSDYLKKIPKFDYILGEGDKLLISIIKDLDDFNIEVVIDASGTIVLPRLSRVYVAGLSVNELVNILNIEYKTFIKDPNVEIIVKTYRPIRVFVDGEVDKSGLLNMAGSFSTNNGVSKPITRDYYFPTVFDAIRQAGGVNYFSDLSNIEISRVNNLSNGGDRINIKLDFTKVLNGIDPSLNLRIYDGDYIKIKRSKAPVISQISKAISTNLNPEFISVNVSGRVEKGGLINLKKSSTLNDAIDMAGGLKATRGNINFIRINNTGEIDRRKFKFKRSEKRGGFKNPFLQPGDLIYVGKSKFNIANEIITDVTRPFVGLYGTGKFFDLID